MTTGAYSTAYSSAFKQTRAYYYVRDDGTATGDDGRYLTQQTGSWASAFPGSPTAYYEDLDACVNSSGTNVQAGDYVLVSSSHRNPDYPSNITLLGPAADRDYGHRAFAFIVSVDDSAIDTYKSGATEELLNGTAYFHLGWILEGINWVGGAIYNPSGTYRGGGTLWSDVSFDYRTGSPGGNWFVWHESDATFYETKVSADTRHYYFIPQSNSYSRWFGLYEGGQGSPIGGPKQYIFHGYSGGNAIDIYGANFFPGPDWDFFRLSQYNGEESTFNVNGFKFLEPWSGNFIDPTAPVRQRNHRERVTVVNYGEGADDWSYYHYEVGCSFEATNAVYHNGSPTMADESTRISYRVDTDTGVSLVNLVLWQMPIPYIDLNATPTITVKIAYTGSGLTDADIGLYLAYPDNTNPNEIRFAASYPTIAGTQAIFNPLATPTALTETGEALTEWTGLSSGDSTYELSITITASTAHANCAVDPILWLWIPQDFGINSLYVSNNVVAS